MLLVASITLKVKSDNLTMLKQFIYTALLAQLFNFNIFSIETIGSLASLLSIILNSISFKFIPKLIQTKQAQLINLPISALSTITAFIWLVFAVNTDDFYFGLSQGLSTVFNFIMVLFYYWATDVINESQTPILNQVMQLLIAFFMMFSSQQKLVSTQLINIQHSAEAIVQIKQMDLSILKDKQSKAPRKRINET